MLNETASQTFVLLEAMFVYLHEQASAGNHALESRYSQAKRPFQRTRFSSFLYLSGVVAIMLLRDAACAANRNEYENLLADSERLHALGAGQPKRVRPTLQSKLASVLAKMQPSTRHILRQAEEIG